MSDGRFNLLFRGEVLDPFSPEQVKKNIAARFGKDPEKVERYFRGETYALARDLTWPEADRLSQTLQELGALVYVQETESPAVREEPAPRAETPARPRSLRSSGGTRLTTPRTRRVAARSATASTASWRRAAARSSRPSCWPSSGSSR